ncbi:MAG: 5-formyltetrahydrofolate cyclo-ligase [Mariprofundaceae bacterium]
MKPGRDKAALRTAVKERRNALGWKQRTAGSASICSRLQQYLVNQSSGASCLLTYRSTADEVDTSSIFADPPCRMFAPRTYDHGILDWLEVSSTTAWLPGAFGIMEPQQGQLWSPEEGVSTLICPMTGFDRQGNRLGMGKGCFDRWLGQYRPHLSHVIGLAFACQEVAEIPAEEHDIPLDIIVTENEIIVCPTS